ncbi:hypothetical protein HUW63_31615 [Myxococcus sp. AM001]|nr:hypothetical protein [Myxococcus sp. AM001]
MPHLSPGDLLEADRIGKRLQNIMHEKCHQTLKTTIERLTGPYDVAHGAIFELRILNQLTDQHLSEAILEWPVSKEKKNTTSIDIFIPSINLAVELQNREGSIVRVVQGPGLMRFLGVGFEEGSSSRGVARGRGDRIRAPPDGCPG